MEYMLMPDRSVRCYEDALSGHTILDELAAHKGTAHYWAYSSGYWGMLKAGDTKVHRLERAEVPHEVLMTDLLR